MLMLILYPSLAFHCQIYLYLTIKNLIFEHFATFINLFNYLDKIYSNTY